MYAMQYDIHFPAGYDMATIRRRVAERGHALDDFDGLGLKAYLVRDIERGHTINSYSPFYLWTQEQAAARFLWGGEGFSGIVRDFTRPSVSSWIGGGFVRGTRYADTATTAIITSVPSPADVDPVTCAHEAAERCETLAASPDAHSVAWLVDPARWSVTYFVLARRPDGITHGAAFPHHHYELFDVLHLSKPEIDDLT